MSTPAKLRNVLGRFLSSRPAAPAASPGRPSWFLNSGPFVKDRATRDKAYLAESDGGPLGNYPAVKSWLSRGNSADRLVCQLAIGVCGTAVAREMHKHRTSAPSVSAFLASCEDSYRFISQNIHGSPFTPSDLAFAIDVATLFATHPANISESLDDAKTIRKWLETPQPRFAPIYTGNASDDLVIHLNALRCDYGACMDEFREDPTYMPCVEELLEWVEKSLENETKRAA